MSHFYLKFIQTKRESLFILLMKSLKVYKTIISPLAFTFLAADLIFKINFSHEFRNGLYAGIMIANTPFSFRKSRIILSLLFFALSINTTVSTNFSLNKSIINSSEFVQIERSLCCYNSFYCIDTKSNQEVHFKA